MLTHVLKCSKEAVWARDVRTKVVLAGSTMDKNTMASSLVVYSVGGAVAWGAGTAQGCVVAIEMPSMHEPSSPATHVAAKSHM